MDPLGMDGGQVAMGYLSARSCWQVSSTSVCPGAQGFGWTPFYSCFRWRTTGPTSTIGARDLAP